MYTKEDIILSRKHAEFNSKPKRQIITNRTSFYRSIAEQTRDAQELAECIAQARAERLATMKGA